MRKFTVIHGALAILLCGGIAAQPPGVTREQIFTTLPDEEAVAPRTGPYEVLSEPAHGSPGHIVYRPADLAAFPARDSLPVLVWGNGGCSRDSATFAGYLSTIASHGFLVLSTTLVEGAEPGRQTAQDLVAAIDWAEEENARPGAELNGKVDLDNIAAMGQSCGGMLAISAATDPRVDTVGAFNTGVSAPGGNTPPGSATTDDLAKLHGPALYINGHERDFMYEGSRANFDMITHVPAFYGARHGGGHLASFLHPGGGEFANLSADWLLYQLKGNRQARATFVGDNCSLCSNANWDVDSKGLE